jgi:hypothetical protein
MHFINQVYEAQIHIGLSHSFLIHNILPETSYTTPFEVKLGVYEHLILYYLIHVAHSLIGVPVV